MRSTSPNSGFRDKNLAIAAYRRAPPKIRARFDEAVARLHGEAVTLVAEVARQHLTGSSKALNETCEQAAQRLRVLIDEANAIANGETLPDRKDPERSAMSAAKPRSTPCSARAD